MATKIQIPTSVKDTDTRRFIEKLIAIINGLEDEVEKLKAKSTN